MRIPKCAFITWLALHLKLLTKDRLHRVGLDVDTQCVLCVEESESNAHLFFQCEFIKAVSTKVYAEILCILD